ncbi:MAG: hypothetical protein NVSMB19_22070 [Vulcanimicrobiaceae bacterium]
MTVTTLTTAPEDVLTPLTAPRHTLATGAGATPIPPYVPFTVSQDLPPQTSPALTKTLKITLTLPTSISLANLDVFLLVGDTTVKGSPQLVWSVKGAVANSKLTFPATTTAPYRFLAGHKYLAFLAIKATATPAPTAQPTTVPTATPTAVPTTQPTAAPTATPPSMSNGPIVAPGVTSSDPNAFQLPFAGGFSGAIG